MTPIPEVPKVQIAILRRTNWRTHWTEHFKTHKKDHASRRGLLMLVRANAAVCWIT